MPQPRRSGLDRLQQPVWLAECPAYRILAQARVMGGARLAVDSVPPDRASMGSGANNTARYIGG